jgi:hypothetical protein
MDDRIRGLLRQIASLEDALRAALAQPAAPREALRQSRRMGNCTDDTPPRAIAQ